MSKLNRELADRIAEIIGRGNFQNAAAASVGIAEGTIIRWMHRGEKHAASSDPAKRASDYAYLWLKVAQAEGEAQGRLVDIVQEAAKVDARHAEWVLGRRWPANWSRRDNVQLTGEGGGPVRIEGVQDRILEKLSQLVPTPEGGSGGSEQS